MKQFFSLLLLLFLYITVYSGNIYNLSKSSQNTPSPSIGDLVWHDLNGNGVQDIGEQGIEGVIVTLYDENDNQIGNTVTTDANGNYLFENLTDGYYYLKFDVSGTNLQYILTAADQGGNEMIDSDVNGDNGPGTTSLIYIYTSEYSDNIDAGFYLSGKIGDFVFEDNDGDGLQNMYIDEGIIGVEVTLTGVTGYGESISLGTEISDSYGFYEFSDLPPGTYTLHFDVGASGMDAFTEQWGDYTVDDNSDPNPETGDVEDVVLASGEEIEYIDAGFYRYAVVGDYIWNDLNENGIQDPGEPGVSGVEVTLSNVFTNTIYTTTTNSDGYYLFDLSYFLSPAECQLYFDIPDGYEFTIRDAGPDSLDSDVNPSNGETYFFSLYSGMQDLSFDAGMYATGTISGKTWRDVNYNGLRESNEPPMTGVYVVLYRASDDSFVADTISDDEGEYLFLDPVNIYPDDYYIKFEEYDNYAFTFQDAGDDNIDSDVDPYTCFTPDFTLNYGEQVPNMDAGYYLSPPDDCDTEPAGKCEDAQVFCALEELSQYCTTMVEQWEQKPIPGCGGGFAFHNPAWFAFVANAEYMSLIIHAGSCVIGTGNLGIQYGMYDDCDLDNPIYVQCPCVSPGDIPFEVSGLIPGHVYYFFVDGCSGTQCTIWLEILSGTSAPEISGPTSFSCDSQANCDSINIGEVTFTMNEINNATGYVWIIDGEGYYTDDMPSKTLHFHAAGIYTVCGYGYNDCFTGDTLCKTIEVFDFNCSLDSIIYTVGNNTCYTDSSGIIEITEVPDGTGPFIYMWSTEDTTAMIDSLHDGIYIVTITDSLNCSITDTFVITSPSPLNANAYAHRETKFNAKDGIVGVNPVGGIPTYQIIWSTGDSTNTVDSLAPGIYSVTLSDSLNCIDIDTVKVDSFVCGQILLGSDITEVSCFGECDGSIFIQSMDSTASPLHYHWSTGVDSQFLDSLCAGIYIVTATDSFNCQVIDTFKIVQPNDIFITVDTVVDISGTFLGAILITTNDVGNYKYNWSGPIGFSSDKEDIISLHDPGCYTLTINDTLTGCSKDTTICIKDLTGDINIENLEEIKIFPNPATKFIYFEFENNPNEVEFSLIDISGEKLDFSSTKITDRLMKIDFGSIIPGFYLVEIRLMDRIIYKKIIVD
ncbi:MAG TPA: T9SS type A sorting domain-containing protein [Bacteroidetes bacterium]|nr:T9SS type A sorting domain-containing protein [Bacteroidota bacterium]